MSPFKFLSLLILIIPGSSFGQTGLEISEIELIGNVAAEEEMILFNSGLHEGLVLSPDRHEIANAIRSLYNLRIFSDIIIEGILDGPGRIKLRINLTEFPKLDKLVFQGNRKIKKGKLEKTLGFITGQFFGPRDELRAKTQILNLYKKERYLLTEVTMKLGEITPKGRHPLIIKIDEGPRVKLRRVDFHGNEKFTDSKLRKQMKETKPKRFLRGGDFKEENYREDLRNVEEFYKKKGYREAYILSDSLYYDESKKDLFIDITVEEGTRYNFGRITWSGNEIFDDKNLSRLITAEHGEVYSQERFDKTLENLRSEYGNIGHIATQILPRETIRGDSIDVHFEILENDPSKIRMINIVGNSKTKDRVIRRELFIRPGQTFSRSLLERSLRNVMVLNYFNNVEPDVQPNEDLTQIDLTFRVEEKSTGTASVGGGFSAQGGMVGTIGLSIPNFLGNGQLLTFNWEFGSRLSQLRVGFSEPWLFNTPTSLSGSIFRVNRRITGNEFDIRDVGFNIRLGRRLRWPDDYTQAGISYGISETKFIDFDSDSLDVNRPPQLQDNITSRMNFIMSRDSRNLPQFASEGSVFNYTLELAGLGGNINYHRHTINNSFYFPLFWKVALSFKQQFGAIAGFRGSTAPFNQRFTPGGTDLVDGTVLRGYNDRSVGPINATGGLVGGRSMLIYNLEASIPVVPNQVYLLAFFDAGNAWENVGELSLFDLRRSAGLGMRIFAPLVGIIGFDFGWGFDRRRVDGQPVGMLTHFQFGPQFF